MDTFFSRRIKGEGSAEFAKVTPVPSRRRHHPHWSGDLPFESLQLEVTLRGLEGRD